MKEFFKRIFKKSNKKNYSSFMTGSLNEIRSEYQCLLSNDINIISTSLSQGFSSYGNEKPYVLLITYTKNSK